MGWGGGEVSEVTSMTISGNTSLYDGEGMLKVINERSPRAIFWK